MHGFFLVGGCDRTKMATSEKVAGCCFRCLYAGGLRRRHRICSYLRDCLHTLPAPEQPTRTTEASCCSSSYISWNDAIVYVHVKSVSEKKDLYHYTMFRTTTSCVRACVLLRLFVLYMYVQRAGSHELHTTSKSRAATAQAAVVVCSEGVVVVAVVEDDVVVVVVS